MIHKIIRLDGNKDSVTSKTFDNYDDAYIFLEKLFKDSCCSDTDFEDHPGYEIVPLEKIYQKDSLDWRPSKEENHGVVSQRYLNIKKELNQLQKELKCPDNFIYEFIEAIQKEWHHDNCISKVRNKK